VSARAEILFERVSKTFSRQDGGAPVEAVRNLSFTIARGELVAILGKTGCGKSTTFNLIAGLQNPSAGRVQVQGHDPFAEFDWFRGKIGIIFQNDRLMPWRSALDNVALGLELNKMPRAEREGIAASWLARLGLAGPRARLPARALRRHAPARLDRPRLCGQARRLALRRTVQCARRAHRQRVARGIPRTVATDRRYVHLHHPLDR
jgi:ABC-type Fe3+/spermidine/putrescine transport system ATPase subunit